MARPRDYVEMRVGQEFARLLMRDRWAPGDNFFELGGTSIRAALLLSTLAAEFRATPTIEEFMRDPTVEGFAKAVRCRTTTGAEQRLVVVREGVLEPSFHCVHGQSGEVFAFQSLRDRPMRSTVTGLRAVGTDGLREPLGSVPAMADEYLAAIRERQPHGPYVIGGYCLGAWIAYEIATRLAREVGSDQVRLVALELARRPSLTADEVRSLRDARHPLIEDLVNSGPGPRLTFAGRTWHEIATELRGRGLAASDADGDVVRRRLQVVGNNVVAISQYDPVPAPLPTVLAFSSEATPSARIAMRAMLEARGCDVTTYDLTTGHDEMFDCPRLPTLIDEVVEATTIRVGAL